MDRSFPEKSNMNKRKSNAENIPNASKKQKSYIDVNLEDDVVKYYLMPSLQHVSMSNIIITLWSQADIKYQIEKIFNGYGGKLVTNIYRSFSKIGDKVLDKLFQLVVPDRIRKKLTNFVHPIGNEIFNWIQYQDKYIFYTSDYAYQNLKSIAINYIDYLTWTARGIIDYKETAKILIAKEKKLPDVYKFNIACAYCLEDDIAIIAPKVINISLTLTSIESQAMTYFWTAHITGDFTELDKEVYSYNRKHRTNDSTNECLLKILIDNPTNQVAIKYIWDKLNNEEKSRQIVQSIKKIPNKDIRCFLLSQISKEQVEEVFQSSEAKEILLGFIDDWLWGQYFLPTMHHILDILPGTAYLRVLERIVDKIVKTQEDIEKYNRYKSMFKELWIYAPNHLKEYGFECWNSFRCPNFFLNLFNKKNIDMIQLILADICPVQKKQIIFSNYGFEKCSSLLTSNQWDLLEMFISQSLFSEKDVERFKKRLIKEKGRKIAVHLIQNKEWNEIELFLKWAFKSDADIREFKLKLAYSKICVNILESIVANNEANFMELEHFFKWCASSNSERVFSLKSKIPGVYFDKVIYKLVKEDKYELLDQMLNWRFINDPIKIAQFKQYFYQSDQIHKIVNFVVDLIEQDDQLQAFKKFIHYWCFIDEEINKFKTCILHPMKQTVGVCIILLSKDMFELADEFVSWCFNSSQIEIDKYKTKLFLDDGMKYLSGEDDLRKFYEAKILKWFKPCKKTIRRFKEKFMNCWWLNYVSSVLHNYIKEQKHIKLSKCL